MRQHSIKTTYLIHKTLIDNSDMTELIPEENMYLLVAEPETDYPYLVIKRTGIQSERGNKDFSGDIVSFSITVYSDKYDEAADIADAARFSIENHILQDDSVRLENIQITGASEDWVSDAYEQTVSFRAEVIKPIENS